MTGVRWGNVQSAAEQASTNLCGHNYFELSPPHLILPAPRQGTAAGNVSDIEKKITFSASDEVGTVLQYFKRLFNAEKDREDTTRMDKTAGKTYNKMERQSNFA